MSEILKICLIFVCMFCFLNVFQLQFRCIQVDGRFECVLLNIKQMLRVWDVTLGKWLIMIVGNFKELSLKFQWFQCWNSKFNLTCLSLTSRVQSSQGLFIVWYYFLRSTSNILLVNLQRFKSEICIMFQSLLKAAQKWATNPATPNRKLTLTNPPSHGSNFFFIFNRHNLEYFTSGRDE